MTQEQELAAQRLRCALDMHEAGVALMLQNLRRRFPSATQSELDERLIAWLCDRPDAALGDAPGARRAGTK